MPGLWLTPYSHPSSRSAEFRDFLKIALDKNPETRPSAAQLLQVSEWGSTAFFFRGTGEGECLAQR